MKAVSRIFGAFALSCAAAGVFAAEQVSQKDLDKIKAAVGKTLSSGKPGITVDSVEATGAEGLYKATITGGQHVYTTADGKYFVVGDLYTVTDGRMVNVTEESRNGDRAKLMAEVDKKDAIIFSPEGEVKKVMYVFTDVDCGYCQKLHALVPEYNELGIEVRYLAYPRAGVGSGSYRKIASAWCADDRQAALTKLKQRQQIPENVCPDNPVAEQFALGRAVGLSGTPALVFEDGQLIGGFVEPQQLADMLNL